MIEQLDFLVQIVLNNSRLMYNRTIKLWHSTTIFVIIMRINLQNFAVNQLFVFVLTLILTLVLTQVELTKH